ncbi:MAG: nitroreductase [Clostridia bacterium]|nr:nitroreductase [Clostridia bacterium]
MKEQVLAALTTRRSVRSYQKTQVDEQALQDILEAGRYAATGRGLQSPLMIVVQDAEVREQLRRMNAEIMGTPDADPFYGAPTIIIVLADRSVPTCVEDGSLVLGNLMNAAHAVGVDSCWIHRARQEFESEEGKALLNRLGIDGDYIGVGHLILGYREGELPAPKPRKQNYVYRL